MYPMDTITGAGVCGGYSITWRISGDIHSREMRNINAFVDDFCATWRPSGKTLVAEPRHYADLAHHLAHPTSAVEYYLSCAWVQELTGLLVEDPSRTELVGSVRDGLEHIVARNPSAAPARVLYDALTAAAESGNEDEAADYANALYHWIPRDSAPTSPKLTLPPRTGSRASCSGSTPRRASGSRGW